MIIYIATASYGSYEDTVHVNIGATTNREEAIQICKDFVFPDDSQNYADVEVWSEGKIIENIHVRD